MKIPRTVLAAAIILQTSFPPSFFAQVPMVRPSIDVRVLNSESVVIGRIATITRKVKGPGDGGDLEIEISVEETLKGEPRSRITPAKHFDKIYVDRSKSKRIILFGNDFESLDGGDPLFVGADGTILHTPDEVTRYVREVVKGHPGVNHIASFEVPNPIKWSREFNLGYKGLLVPADVQLEKWAFDVIQSADRSLRIRGVDALKFFKSEQNVTFVKGLLKDSDSYLSRIGPGKGIEVRSFPIRRQAYETLKYWEVKVDKPVIDEPTSNNQEK